MAFSNRPTALLVYDLVDETGSRSKAEFHVPFATLAAVALAAADTMAGFIAALTGCTVTGYGLTYGVTDPTFAAPAAGSRIEHKGRWIFGLANGLTSRVEIPGLLDTVVLGDGAIDQANVDVLAFQGAVVGVGAVFAGIDGSDIVSTNAAYEAFRRSTRKMLPSRKLA